MTKRELIYQKFNGLCAYTGKHLDKDWQIDHIEPQYKFNEGFVEGDVVDYYDWTNTAYSNRIIGKVVYNHCEFYIYNKPVWSERYLYSSLNPDNFSTKKRTVMGNIYENKELLK